MTAQTPDLTLTASTRTIQGKQVKQLRQQGLLPAVLYGNGQTSLSLTLNAREFSSLFHQAGSTTLVNLVVEGQKPVKVLIQEVHSNPIRREPIHVDFYKVNLKEKLRTDVPLQFIGTSPMVELEGGTLITAKDSVEIECLPDDLIQHIEVDISVLATFDDSIRVSDLKVPASVTILDDPDGSIASVAKPISEEELANLDAPVEASLDHVVIETEEGTVAAPEEEGKETKE